jgi:hypothetical protein
VRAFAAVQAGHGDEPRRPARPASFHIDLAASIGPASFMKHSPVPLHADEPIFRHLFM